MSKIEKKILKLLPIIIMVVIALNTADLQRVVLGNIGMNVLMLNKTGVILTMIPVLFVAVLVIKDIIDITTNKKPSWIGFVTISIVTFLALVIF